MWPRRRSHEAATSVQAQVLVVIAHHSDTGRPYSTQR
jgi:hypothetical protein